jgi:hypothetical protein
VTLRLKVRSPMRVYSGLRRSAELSLVDEYLAATLR